jgi:hypothetical protein
VLHAARPRPHPHSLHSSCSSHRRGRQVLLRRIPFNSSESCCSNLGGTDQQQPPVSSGTRRPDQTRPLPPPKSQLHPGHCQPSTSRATSQTRSDYSLRGGDRAITPPLDGRVPQFSLFSVNYNEVVVTSTSIRLTAASHLRRIRISQV